MTSHQNHDFAHQMTGAAGSILNNDAAPRLIVGYVDGQLRVFNCANAQQMDGIINAFGSRLTIENIR